MNERIAMLAKKANSFACANENVDSVYNAFVEEFTKLIRQELVVQCEDIALKHQQTETTYAAGQKAGALECAEMLKAYFHAG